MNAPLPDPVRTVGSASPEPRVLADGLLRLLERPFVAIDRWIDRALPEDLNPLARTGAIANVTFLIAAITGVLLLFWYVPSVHQAYDSVVAMHAESPLLGGLMRSLHRYSSDACVFFFTVHAFKLFFARRFGGARWLAWVTGVAAVLVLWFTGWTGYWLVWDERGRQVALATAKLADVLPIFIDPVSASFLVDSAVNTLLFFVVFFVHMLIPFGAVVALWLHITRLRRARWLTNKALTWWVVGTLVVLSLVFPADVAERAQMAVEPESFAMDWWYLAPLLIGERIGGGAGWAFFLLASLLMGTIPWTMARKRAATAAVEEKRCNACQKCEQDCPYAAITMVPRTDGKDFVAVASVDPSLCVGCGICAGSCDTAGVGVALAPDLAMRKTVAGWFKALDDGAAGLAILCAEGAGEGFTVDPETGECPQLPDWRVLPVPCAGAVHPLMVEGALRAGASRVVFGACGPGNCHFREGGLHAELRMTGQREPSLRTDKVDPSRVTVEHVGRGGADVLIDALRGTGDTRERSKAAGIALGAALAAGMAVLIGVFSVGPYWTAAPPDPQLVVSLKHPGQVGEDCRQVSAEEKAAMPIHMRQDQICERRRADVRIQVEVDGVLALDSTIPPAGLWGDGNSIAIERLSVPDGDHTITARLADGLDPDAWGWESTQVLTFRTRERRILEFGRNDGFVWH